MLIQNTIGHNHYLKKSSVCNSTWFLKRFKNNINVMCLLSCSLILSVYLFHHTHICTSTLVRALVVITHAWVRNDNLNLNILTRKYWIQTVGPLKKWFVPEISPFSKYVQKGPKLSFWLNWPHKDVKKCPCFSKLVTLQLCFYFP